MKKSLLIHIVLIISSAVGGGFLANYLHVLQNDIDQTRTEVSKAPIAGFQKLASDMEWMLFVNYMGSIGTVDDSNVDEITERLKKIIAYDPNLDKTYEIGVLAISNKSPQTAVDFLEKACKNAHLKKSWKIPFYTGFVLTHNFNGDKEKAKEAVKYFRMAIDNSGGDPKPYVVSCYLQAKTMAAGGDNPKYTLLKVLFDEWKYAGQSVYNGVGAPLQGGATIPGITKRLLSASQQAKASDPKGENIELAKLIQEVKKRVLYDRHLCGKCLAPYKAGDIFCSQCGDEVEVYGVCPQCNSTLTGSFCSKCGFKKR